MSDEPQILYDLHFFHPRDVVEYVDLLRLYKDLKYPEFHKA